ncbi:MAG: putative ATPase [Saprospiraceae bacterium]|jgi:predicted ATPase
MIKGRYIITGAPSSGKTTVLNELSNHNVIFDEAARKVIQEQLQLNSDKVPWLNNYEFSKLVVSQQIKDHETPVNSAAFYDRGIPDVIAYLKHYNQNQHLQKFLNYANEYRYADKVFLMPPWEDIYQTDVERKENFKEAQSINDQLIETYLALNYEIIEVPFVNSKERVKFILDQINL